MKNLKLIRLLKTFSSIEFQEFGKFVNSPYFNESRKLIALYNALKKYYPSFEDLNLTKENLFEKLYGTLKFDDKKVRDRLSDLLKLAEEFLAFNQLKKDPFDQKFNTLKEFLARRLDIHFEKKYKELRSLLDVSITKNELYYFREYMLSYELLGFHEFKQLLGRRRSFYESLCGNIEDFEKYFSVNMLKYFSIMNNVKGISDHEYDYRFRDAVYHLIEKTHLDSNPLIKGQILMSVLINDHKNTEAYFDLKKLYLESHKELFIGDKVMFITELYNHATVRYLDEVQGFEEEVFEVIKLQLNHGIYPMQDGWMQREQFFIMILAGQRFGASEWGEKFYKDMIDKVVPEERENTRSWAKGYLNFIKGDYTSSLGELSKVKTADYYYYFNTKSILLKVYYELEDFERALSLVDSYRHYVASNDFIPKGTKMSNLNFIKSFGKLIKLSENPDEFKLDKYIKETESSTFREITLGKYWLIEKAQALKQKFFKYSMQV